MGCLQPQLLAVIKSTQEAGVYEDEHNMYGIVKHIHDDPLRLHNSTMMMMLRDALTCALKPRKVDKCMDSMGTYENMHNMKNKSHWAKHAPSQQQNRL